MISLTPEGMTRKDYLDSKGIKVARPEAVKEFETKRPLLPICLVTYPMYSGAFLCFNIDDAHLIESGPAIKWEWYLVDIDEITNDFPQFAHAIKNSWRKV